MILPKIKSNILIQSYKHNHKLHRSWLNGFVIEANMNQIVFVTDYSIVVEANSRSWKPKEPAICFYYPDRWYNVIAMIKDNSIIYYCNIASPCIFDNNILKNIDYDLDIKVFKNKDYIILDQKEYQYHSSLMNYSSKLKYVIENTLEDLKRGIECKILPFDDKYISKYYKKYIQLLEEDISLDHIPN